MAIGGECPKKGCQHQLMLHDVVITGDGNHLQLVCRWCFAHGAENPVCASWPR